MLKKIPHIKQIRAGFVHVYIVQQYTEGDCFSVTTDFVLLYIHIEYPNIRQTITNPTKALFLSCEQDKKLGPQD